MTNVSTNPQRLRLGIPKGSLQETTQKLFIRAGYDLRISGRSYYPDIDDAEIECILIRPQEMSRYVGQGILDCAITGLDWILENDIDVAQIADLRAPWPNYGTVRWVMASKDDSPFHSVKDLQGRRIATEAVGMTKRFLAQHGVQANVEFSWGATEVKPPILADAIVDVSETGASLRATTSRSCTWCREHAALHRLPRFAHGRLEKRKDRLPADAAQGRDRRRNARAAVDEPAAGASRCGAENPAGAGDAHGFDAGRPALGRPVHGGRGKKGARADSAALRCGRARIIELPLNKIVE